MEIEKLSCYVPHYLVGLGKRNTYISDMILFGGYLRQERLILRAKGWRTFLESDPPLVPEKAPLSKQPLTTLGNLFKRHQPSLKLGCLTWSMKLKRTKKTTLELRIN